jgi:hypothetical protein
MSKFRVSVTAAAAALAVLAASAASAQILEDLTIASVPTAGVLPHGGYLFYGSVGPESSILVSAAVGFFDRLLLGASFGLQDLIGRGGMSVNDRIGLQARLRLVEETISRPAFTLGIDTQGEGKYIESAERYERKSRGLFLVAGKNYRFIDDLSLNGGINYSFEDRDESGLNLFGGVEIGIVRWMSLLFDYDLALDDGDAGVATSRTRGRGYLDSGLRLDYRDNLRFKILFKDLLGNYIPETGVYRAIEVWYINVF